MAQKKNTIIEWEPYNAFVQEFRDETDRAAVVLGAAKLDLIIYQILKAFLIPSAGSKDSLLDGNSPLGTFSSKIDMMHRLGLIAPAFSRTLHLIRKIRNAFAHEVSGCSLQTGAHSDRVKELSLPFKNLELYKSIKTHFFEEKTGPGIEFRAVLSIIVGRLEALLLTIEVIKTNETWDLISQVWREDEKDTSSNKNIRPTSKSASP